MMRRRARSPLTSPATSPSDEEKKDEEILTNRLKEQGDGVHASMQRNVGSEGLANLATRRPGDAPGQSPETYSSFYRKLGRLFRICLIDLPLFIAFASFLLAFCIRHVHDKYYTRLFDQAERTDEQLLEEFTYYKRDCNAYDLTTPSNMSELFVDSKASTDSNVERFLTHGAMIFPELLTPDEALDLRNYIQRRNSQVTEAEEYPVSQGEHRISYGIEPTEDAAVAHAVKTITTNPTFRRMITTILGDADPASAEITAITGYYGCPYQIWHSDTKADGNALFYARTYAHSYSIFVPLQNTTSSMGITDFAPGTQYCGNDVRVLCEGHGMGLDQAMPDGVFPAGSGALLNQHIWHRGGAHTDPAAPERIMFILSFLSRPKPHDPRMLARGTYFHQKWSMWGMTYRDLMDPYRTMGKPWNLLRCLSMYKPWDRNLGWDLVTATYLRFANGQMQDDDFTERFLPRLDELGVPIWLHGDVLHGVSQKKVWSHFIQGTIERIYSFVKLCCMYLHAAYCIGFFFLCACRRCRAVEKGETITRTMPWALFIYGMATMVAFLYLHFVDRSVWGQNITHGRIWKRPFPSQTILRQDKSNMTSMGPTTVPTRDDILSGTRFDAKYLGSYDKWLDLHYGNKIFRTAVDSAARMYFLLSRSSSNALMHHLLQHVKASSTGNEGRFLQQDYRSGDWRVMSEIEANETIQSALMASSNELTGLIANELDYIIADYRFGALRDSALASHSEQYFWQMKRRILGVSKMIPEPLVSSMKCSITAPHTVVTSFFRLSANMAHTKRLFRTPLAASGEIRSGSNVWTYYEDDEMQGWYPSTVLSIERDGIYLVSYDAGTEELVEKERIHKRLPLLEGDKVVGCHRPRYEDCLSGTILRVMPNQDVSIAYDNGQIAERVSIDYYYRPPYAHLPAPDDDDFIPDEEDDDDDDDDEEE